MKQIIIGKEGNQPFLINDEYVSRHHATFFLDESTGIMTLTDNKSRNGTYINMGGHFQQISQCNVDATTIVRLGPFFSFKIGKLLQMAPAPPPPAPPKEEKVNIAYLRKVAENYEDTKIRLEQKQANINSLRSLSLVGTLAAGGISAIIPKAFGSEDWYLYVLGPAFAVAFLISLMAYCSKASKDVITQKNRNEKQYKLSFCCPKCHLPYTGKLYENILAEGKCPRCKTKFYD